jgi:hypothetical protein
MVPTIILLACTLAAEPISPLSIDREVIDAGTVKAGPSFKRTFTFKHTGNEGSLLITSIDAGCGCLRSSSSKSTLGPGESAEITLEVNTITQPEGQNNWRATVEYLWKKNETELPKNEKKIITISAKVEREIAINPPMIAFSTKGYEELEQTITIKDSRPNSNMNITKLHSSSNFVTAEMQKDGTIKVKLSVQTQFTEKPQKETITILTDDPIYPEFRIPISYEKKSSTGLKINPEKLFVRFATAEATKSGTIQIRESSGKEFTIQSAACTHPGITLTFSKDENPVNTVKAQIDRSQAGISGETEITVTTTTGAVRKVSLSWNQ